MKSKPIKKQNKVTQVSEIIEKVIAVLDVKGTEGLVLRGLAKELGVSTTIVYTLFGSKEVLEQELLNYILIDISTTCNAIDEDKKKKRVRLVFNSILDYFLRYRNRAVLALNSTSANAFHDKLIDNAIRPNMKDIDFKFEIGDVIDTLYSYTYGFLSLKMNITDKEVTNRVNTEEFVRNFKVILNSYL